MCDLTLTTALETAAAFAISATVSLSPTSQVFSINKVFSVLKASVTLFFSSSETDVAEPKIKGTWVYKCFGQRKSVTFNKVSTIYLSQERVQKLTHTALSLANKTVASKNNIESTLARSFKSWE